MRDNKMGMPDKVGSMNVVRAVASICSLIVCTSFSIDSQQSQPPAQTPTFRVQSSLVLVDVITKDRNSGLPIKDFQKKDGSRATQDSAACERSAIRISTTETPSTL
jgi:hypothetical protein